MRSRCVLHAVEVVGAVEQLVEEVARLVLVHALVRDDVVEHLAAVRVLHDEVDRRRRVEHLEELHDVAVPVALEDLDLARDALHVGDLDDAALLEDLDRDLLAREDVRADLHLARRALADRLAEDVVPDHRRAPRGPRAAAAARAAGRRAGRRGRRAGRPAAPLARARRAARAARLRATDPTVLGRCRDAGCAYGAALRHRGPQRETRSSDRRVPYRPWPSLER